jgi:hypothetical protein
MIKYAEQKQILFFLFLTCSFLLTTNDQGNAILEIRAGIGGSEAQLFTQEIFDMYHQYPIMFSLLLIYLME